MTIDAEIRYAKTRDGANLAYQVWGEGPVDIVFAAHIVPVDLMADDPEMASAIERLASFSRLVLFDFRGHGASDPLPAGRAPTLEESGGDVLAVMDAAGSDRAFLMKSDNPSDVVVMAASNPERVAGLILINAYARLKAAADYPFGFPEHLGEKFFAVLDRWAMDEVIDYMCAPRRHDPVFRRWFLRAMRASAGPAVSASHLAKDLQTDVRYVLPLVQVPALVLHSVENPYIRLDHGRYLAEHIPGARFVELPGDGHNVAAIDLDLFVEEVSEFVTGVRPRPRIDRVFATVLFSDIVDSTPLAVRLGDRRWKALLDQHDAVVERQLERFDGVLVKTTGDGVVATFDGPARAVACAAAIRDALRRLEMQVRIGIHAGEIERRGDDVSGVAVNVAARVQSKAAPAEIIVSRTVVDVVAGSGIEFADRGEHDLKGVPGTWQLYEARLH